MIKVLRSTVALTFALLAVATLAGPSGCAAIVGADDYQVGVAEGTAGSVGQSGSQVGAGGSDGTGGGGTGGSRPGSGGSRSSDASAPPDATVKKEAGIDPMSSDASRADGGLVDTGKPMPAGSGESLCTTTCTGAGLNCVHTTWGPSGICVYGCPVSNSECDSNHSCIHATDPKIGLDYSCLRNCPTGVCPAGMACLPLATVSICEPKDWFPKDLGLGDDCLFDEQCTSGQCFNKPNGWCTRPCHAYDGDFDYCDGDYTNGRNYYGEYNWCVATGVGNRCVPGCGESANACSNYPGTTCKTVLDVDAYEEEMCSP